MVSLRTWFARLGGWLLLVLGACWPCAAEAPGEHPDWLDVATLRPGERLACTVVAKSIASARLRLAADFCRARVVINDQPIATIEPYCQTQVFDVTEALRLGENRLEILPDAVPDAPAVLAASLTIVHADGTRQSSATDRNWSVIGTTGEMKSAFSYGQVRAELWGLDRREVSIDPFENYEQWQQAKGAGGTSPKFFLAPGFEIRQLRVAQGDEGSWVSLAVDERGRLTIAREDQGFLRMTVSDDGQTVDQVQAIGSDLLECRGLVYRDGWLYASANNSKTLFRLKLTDDGLVTDQTALRELAGGVGHGRNDLCLEGNSLHWICGDSVDPPLTDILDHTSPLRRSVASEFTREGSLLRMSLDGQKWELLCAGLRNPYGVAKIPLGHDLFTYDADNEYDLGMPWYRPTRILQLMEGGDYGYREASGRIPPRFADQADNAPPLIDIGRGSPTAVAFDEAFHFPEPYHSALFALDWTYGRVIAVHLDRRGATFRASTELFLQGKPLNVTDVAAGRDGAMYLITGGRKTQSALYRVHATPAAFSRQNPRAPKDNLLGGMMTYAQRQQDVIERFQSAGAGPGSMDSEAILPFLDAPDPVVRYLARLALERLPASTWRQAVLEEHDGRRAIRELMAAARLLDPESAATIVHHLLTHSSDDLSIDGKLVWLRILDLCLMANAEAVLSKRLELETVILSHWQACQSPRWQVSMEGTNADYRRRAALLLARLESTHLPELAARDLLSSSVQEDQIAGLMALRNQRAGWTVEARDLQLQTLAGMPQMVGGEGLPVFHAWLESETVATLSPAEEKAYAAQVAAHASVEPLPPARPKVQTWTIDELQDLSDDVVAGNAERGSLIFRDALCARCHRFGTQGRSVGPDLTVVAGRFSRRDILDSILNPSKAVAENYRSVTIQTTDGKVLTGRVVAAGDFRAENLRLITDSLRPDQVVEIDKKSIEVHHPSDRSPMPEGLLDTFTREEIADLLAYLTGAIRKQTPSE